MKKRIVTAILVFAFVLTAIAPMTVLADWEKQSDGSWKYYADEIEGYYSGDHYTIGEKEYYFDDNGKMLTGWFKIDFGGYEEWFYADSSGALQAGWKEIGGKWYYFEPDYYYMYSNGRFDIKAKTYYFAKSGAMLTGWISNTYTYEDGTTYREWYYAGSDGALVEGWKKINGKWYYFGYYYQMYSDGVRYIDGKPYYFYPNGELGTGWIKKTYFYDSGYSFSEWYYANSSGVLQTGWQKINGSWYYFSEYGFYMYSEGQYTIAGQPYAFDENGRMITGWGKVTRNYGDGYVDETWYLADGSGILKKGWQQIGNAWYYLDPEYYYMHTGYSVIDGKVYMFNGSGVWTTKPGWLEVKYPNGSSWYYLDASGQPVKGWKKLGGVWYFFNSYSGEMASNGVQYVYDENTGESQFYAFAKNGALISGSGWQQFTYPNGASNWVYTNNGELLTGWQKINGTWYYFYDPYGYMATGDVVVDGKISRFTSGGAWIGYVTKVGWYKIDNGWYYVKNTNGDLYVGWLEIGGKKYYLTPYMYNGDWYFIDGNRYFFDTSGALMTGWIEKWGDTYYSNSDGVMLNGWQTIGGYKYYFDPNGYYMYRDGTYTIAEVDYYFDYEGHCLD